jgi:hypothetical protein
LATEAAIERLVRDFESLALPCAHWTHSAHLAVAVAYLRRLGFEAALEQLRLRINAFNRACGNPDGYNETLTILFLRRIAAELSAEGEAAPMTALVARLERLCPSDWVAQYYSPERIASPQARQSWVEPDRRALEF